MSNVVNLNKFRKKKQREAEVKKAEENRIRHGRTKAEKERDLAERAKLARLVDGHRLDRDEATSDATPKAIEGDDADGDEHG
jgi:hypothetical protein